MKTGQKIKKNNSGFSMVEIMLVLGIAALLAGVSIQGFHYLSYGNTKKCAERIISGIDEVQMMNMTQERVTFLGIFREKDVIYLQRIKKEHPTRSDVSVKEAEKISEGLVTLKWEQDGEVIDLDETTLLLIGFSKASGAYITEQEAAGGTVYTGDLWISGRGIFHIVQVAETGKHYISE